MTIFRPLSLRGKGYSSTKSQQNVSQKICPGNAVPNHMGHPKYFLPRLVFYPASPRVREKGATAGHYRALKETRKSLHCADIDTKTRCDFPWSVDVHFAVLGAVFSTEECRGNYFRASEWAAPSTHRWARYASTSWGRSRRNWVPGNSRYRPAEKRGAPWGQRLPGFLRRKAASSPRPGKIL